MADLYGGAPYSNPEPEEISTILNQLLHNPSSSSSCMQFKGKNIHSLPSQVPGISALVSNSGVAMAIPVVDRYGLGGFAVGAESGPRVKFSDPEMYFGANVKDSSDNALSSSFPLASENQISTGSFQIMAIAGPITPGQVSFFLGIFPVISAWIYAEYLQYKKNSLASKARHSDVNLVEIGNGAVKEEDRAVLLEGGGLQSGSPKARSSTSSFSPILKFLMMDETFLAENRLTLRAISEFGVLLAYYYICDRTDVFASSHKNYNQDLFLFLYFLLIIVSAITSFTIHHDKSSFSGKAILYLNRHQTEEWKGWMQVLFLMYHYFAAIEIYNALGCRKFQIMEIGGCLSHRRRRRTHKRRQVRQHDEEVRSVGGSRRGRETGGRERENTRGIF